MPGSEISSIRRSFWSDSAFVMAASLHPGLPAQHFVLSRIRT